MRNLSVPLSHTHTNTRRHVRRHEGVYTNQSGETESDHHIESTDWYRPGGADSVCAQIARSQSQRSLTWEHSLVSTRRRWFGLHGDCTNSASASHAASATCTKKGLMKGVTAMTYPAKNHVRIRRALCTRKGLMKGLTASSVGWMRALSPGLLHQRYRMSSRDEQYR